MENKEKQSPLFSVIVPLYNAERWLGRCLESIAAQTFPDWECILVDDGSQDGSGVLCDAWCQKDPRFRVIHQPNSGVSQARNRGMEQARGSQILFCDADDALSPCTLAYAAEMRQSAPGAMVIWGFTHDRARFEEEGQKPLSWSLLPKAAFDGLAWVEILYNAVWNRLFDASLLRQKGLLFREELGRAGAAVLCEDGEFVARYLEQCQPETGWQIAYCPLPLYYYSQDNPASLSTTATGKGEPGAEPALRPQLEQTLRREWDGLKAYAPRFPEEYCQQPDGVVLHYLESAAQLIRQDQREGKEIPRSLLAHPCMRDMLDYCRRHRLYSPYYLPLRTCCYSLAGRLWRLQASGSRWYGRLDWLGYYLLGGRLRGWKH